MASQITGWVPVETMGIEGRVRADHEALHLDRLSWAYLTPAMWAEFRAAGDQLMAGIQGRKAVELAEEAGTLKDLADYAPGAFPFPAKVPAPADMTDADWGHVADVLRVLPGSFGPLRKFWDAAEKALETGEGA
jgi:hypothetical protein